jgi:aspartyl/asparaginyl-tRNA synthetase
MIKNKIPRMGLIVIFSSLMLFSCSGFFTTPINKILANPRAYAGKTVKVSGEVTQIFSLLVIKYFKVRDGTGEIIVVTEKPLPKIGTKIKVKGTVEEAFSIGDQQLIVIVEKNDT